MKTDLFFTSFSRKIHITNYSPHMLLPLSFAPSKSTVRNLTTHPLSIKNHSLSKSYYSHLHSCSPNCPLLSSQTQTLPLIHSSHSLSYFFCPSSKPSPREGSNKQLYPSKPRYIAHFTPRFFCLPYNCLLDNVEKYGRSRAPLSQTFRRYPCITQTFFRTPCVLPIDTIPT